jgi:hypothetical protein
MFLRLTGGNAANPYPGTLDPAPEYDERKISGHEFIIVFQEWDYSVVTKAQAVAEYNFTHADDSADLDSLNGWYQAANDKAAFLQVLEGRIILAREKQNAAGNTDLDGTFGYAVKATLIGGADGNHSLKNTGPAAARFNSWA